MFAHVAIGFRGVPLKNHIHLRFLLLFISSEQCANDNDLVVHEIPSIMRTQLVKILINILSQAHHMAHASQHISSHHALPSLHHHPTAALDP